MKPDSQCPAQPLVSVVVLTYNSEATLAETLASIAQQDYGNIEILICDDGSSDGTMAIASGWRQELAGRFERIALLPSARNQGICRNVAAGYAAARGTWIKPIAGDDILAPQAISRYVLSARSNNHAVVVSAITPFSDLPGGGRTWGAALPAKADLALFAGPPGALLSALLLRNVIPAPGTFIERAALEEVGGVDLDFMHLDDWPLWIRLLRGQKQIGFCAEPLVGYRVGAQSISAFRPATSVNRDLLGDLHTFYRKYQKDSLQFWDRWDLSLQMIRLRQARGALRRFPRIYALTAVVRLLSPRFWRARLHGGQGDLA